MAEALRAGDEMATRAITTTESLLAALDSAAREMDETMPAAVERLDSRFAASKAVVVATKPELLALVTAAESTHDAIEAIAQVIADQRRNVDALTGTLLESLTSGRAKAARIFGLSLGTSVLPNVPSGDCSRNSRNAMPSASSARTAGMNTASALLSSAPCESPLGERRTAVRSAPA